MTVVKLWQSSPAFIRDHAQAAADRVESASGRGDISVRADSTGGFAQGSSVLEFEVVQEVVTPRPAT